MVVSPPYISLNAYAKRRRRKRGIFTLNSNQAYDLMLGAFENGYAEGTFTLPRGHREKMDKQDHVRTKMREFVEETGLWHRQFHPHHPELYHNFHEEWIGLNNVHYKADYSLFVVNTIEELQKTERHMNENDYNDRYDILKRHAFVPLKDLNVLINNNKYKRIVDIDVERINDIVQRKIKTQQFSG